MIRRLVVRNLLSFSSVALEFAPGLVVFTGPSGAGKSLLMQAMLANLGLGASEAELCEVEMDLPEGLECDRLILEDPLVIRAIRRERSRYYLNDQHLSHKRLKELFEGTVHYLSVRDRGVFSRETLLEILDLKAGESEEFPELRERYRTRYGRYRQKRRQAKELRDQARQIEERREFLRFEIDKIASIDPKEEEYEELMLLKQRLSRLERIKESARAAAEIFEYEGRVQELFDLMEKDGEYFSDAMNQLRIDLEGVEQLAQELEEVDVEQVLDRLEALAGLIKRHGGVAEALAYKAAKEEELSKIEHLQEDLEGLEQWLEEEKKALESLAREMGGYRREAAERISGELAGVLERLKLPRLSFLFEEEELTELGCDRVDVALEGSTAATLSGGEFNRLRLALMYAVSSRQKGSVIFLDEIDANVSGDESIAIAEMIGELARRHQIFAISHQPHLSARAHQHILVHKEGGESRALELDESRRIRELARIVSGEQADEEALAFAAKLRQGAKE